MNKSTHLISMDVELQAIVKNQEELRLKIQSLRSMIEEFKAFYGASQAQLNVKELVTSLGTESKNIGLTVRRAEERIQDSRARVLAINELIEQGLDTETFADSKDDVERKVRYICLNSVVDAELAKLKLSVAGNSYGKQTWYRGRSWGGIYVQNEPLNISPR